MISSKDIRKILIESKRYPDYVINAMCDIKKKEDFFSPNIPKVIVDKNKNLLYMSEFRGIKLPIEHLKQIKIWLFLLTSL